MDSSYRNYYLVNGEPLHLNTVLAILADITDPDLAAIIIDYLRGSLCAIYSVIQTPGYTTFSRYIYPIEALSKLRALCIHDDLYISFTVGYGLDFVQLYGGLLHSFDGNPSVIHFDLGQEDQCLTFRYHDFDWLVDEVVLIQSTGVSIEGNRIQWQRKWRLHQGTGDVTGLVALWNSTGKLISKCWWLWDAAYNTAS